MIKSNSLAKRYASSYQSKDRGGNSGTRVIDITDTGLELYTPKEGRNVISIIPYTIKTNKHPLVKNKTLEIGDMDYVMDIWEHRGVGANQSSVLCLKHTYGKPCPICEEAERLKKEGKEDEAKALKAKRRVYYNIFDPKDNKIKVFATSHYLFEKELIEEARDDEDGGYIDFADPEEGKEVRFRAVKESLAGQEYLTYKSFSFDDREEPLSKKVLSSAISFDEIMNVPSYDQVEKLLYGDDSDDEEPEKNIEDTPKTLKVAKGMDAEEFSNGDDVPWDTSEEESPKKEVEKATDSSEKNTCDADCSKCPFGHTYGKDTDKYDDCDDCNVWADCYKA